MGAQANLGASVNVTGTLLSQGWATQGIVSVTVNYTPLSTDAIILASASGGALTITLADATQPPYVNGQRYTIIKTDSSASAVTVTGTGGQLVGGASSQSLTAANAYTSVLFDGANWQVWSGVVSVGGGGISPPAGDIGGTGASPTVVNTHLATQTVTSSTTLAASSAPVVLTDTTSAAYTLFLPVTPAAGSLFAVVDDTGKWNTHTLTIGRNGKNIDGAAANLTLTNQWGKIWLYYDGTAWWSLAAGASNETPAAVGTASAGTHNSLSRADHGHSGVATVAATDTSIVVGGTGSAPTVATGTLDVVATQHPAAGNWSNNSHKITNVANGTNPQDAAAFGQIPSVLTQQAATSASGYTLVNGTGTIVSWTTPSDSALHQFTVVAVLHVTSAETGGSIQITWTTPDGTSTTTSVFAGGQTGIQSFSQSKLCQAGTTVTVQQNTALTAGAAVAWVQLWGL